MQLTILALVNRLDSEAEAYLLLEEVAVGRAGPSASICCEERFFFSGPPTRTTTPLWTTYGRSSG